MSQIGNLKHDLQKSADTQKSTFLQRYFKTGKGEYAEGDVFLGLSVPYLRKLARSYKQLDSKDIKKLLQSKIHEYRQIALMILSLQFSTATNSEKEVIYNFYLAHTKWINNWDLIDGSAPTIVGGYLLDKPRNMLFKLSKSTSVWERRIAILATHQFIKEKKEYQDTFRIAELLLADKHDLIHKAVGWMLREVGKRVSRESLEEFLKEHYKTMPRTALRYSIEHFPEKVRRAYIEGRI